MLRLTNRFVNYFISVTLQPISSLRVYKEKARSEHHCVIIS